MVSFILILLTGFQVQDSGKPGPNLATLPPVAEFKGPSLQLMAKPDDPWITPAEKTGLMDTPSYSETVAYLRKMVDATPSLSMVSMGKSLEGRDYWLVIGSNAHFSTPDAIKSSGLPVLLFQAGIHSGEIDGKDAGLMLLRDMTVGGKKTDLLDKAIVLFIPILNVDGHERRSPFNRINQRGPLNMGWRTNAANLNLNRDYTKADTQGIQAVLTVLNRYQPDLYFDIHVTDGIDYQYDVTFGANGINGFSPSVGQYLSTQLFPALNKELTLQGHIPGPLIFARDNRDLSKGIVKWFASPRFSNGYGDLVHIPTVLVENHSLKPYRQRVLGTYVLMERSIRFLTENISSLLKATQEDRMRRTPTTPSNWGEKDKPEQMEFFGIQNESFESAITGQTEVRWLGKPQTITIPVICLDQPQSPVPKPTAFWIPGSQKVLIERMKLHGIQMESIPQGTSNTLTFLRFNDPEFGKEFYEGHQRVQADFVEFRHEKSFPPGSVRVPLDQPLGDLVMVLLDPRFQDSFFQWGFFNQIFERTEYTEAYAMEPLARKMLENPLIKQAFQEKLETDPEFEKSPRARLRWFYERTPYFDNAWKVYPVGRED